MAHRAAIEAQNEENERLAERNRQLAAEVRDLKEGRAALEERARTDLGMVGRNETFFQVVPPAPARRRRPPQSSARRRPADREPRACAAGRSCPRPAAASASAARGPSNTCRCSGDRCCRGRWRRSSPIAPSRAVVVALAPGDRRFAAGCREARDPRVRSVPRAARGAELRWRRRSTALAGEARDEDWVLVHDAARPCLRARRPARARGRRGRRPGRRPARAAAGRHAEARRAATGCSERTVPREGLWRALTPQMFRYGVLRRALALSIERERAVTDEAPAVEALGLRPRLVPGRADNIKVTLPEDLALAAAILAARGGRRCASATVSTSMRLGPATT